MGPCKSLGPLLSFSVSRRFCLLPLSEKLPFLTCATTSHTSLSPFSIVYSFNVKKRESSSWIIRERPKFTRALPWALLRGGGKAPLTNRSTFPPRHWKPALLSLNKKLNFLLLLPQASFCFCYALQKLRQVSKSEGFCLEPEMVQKWVRRGTVGSDAQILQASLQHHPSSRTELPSLLGRQWESSLLLLFWTEEDPANKKSTISFVCDSPHHAQRLFLSSKCEWNPASFHFSDALDYWRCLIHIYFCHLFLATFLF